MASGLTFLEKARLVIATAGVTAAATSAYWVISHDLFGANEAVTQREAKARLQDKSTVRSKASPNVNSVAAKRVALDAVTPVRVGALAIPVVGVKASNLIDTFSDARANGARVHDAIDIMAPRGTPVIAAAPGKVEKIWESDNGGHTVYVRSLNQKLIYYYAHLDAYDTDLVEGSVLKAGDPIGTVGSTGNASPDGPHLHFAVSVMQPGEGWSKGTAINPYPLLVNKGSQ